MNEEFKELVDLLDAMDVAMSNNDWTEVMRLKATIDEVSENRAEPFTMKDLARAMRAHLQRLQ